MAIRKFAAPTTREAMIQVRRELGDDAVIIANRRVGNRIEILAAAPDAVDALVERSEVRAAAPMREAGERPAQREPAREQPREQNREPARQKVEAFQDFVRRQMQSDNDVPAQPRVARELPLRANTERAAIAPNNNPGVAMYHDVADIEDDEAYTPPQPERAPMRSAAPAVARRAPATAPVREDNAPRRQPQAMPTQPSHRAQQIESLVAPADPAVFRRRPAHVAASARVEVPAAAARPAPAAPAIDIVLEPQAVLQPEVQQVVQPTAQPVVSAAPVVPQPESRTAPSEPAATGHAPVPSLPVRSQAGPIATAARLREASILAAAEMTAAMQPVQIDTPRAMAVTPVAPVMQQAVAPAAPAIDKTPAAPAIAGWSWRAQFVASPVVVAAPVVVAPNAAPVQPVVQAPAQPVAQPAPEAAVQAAAHAPVSLQAPVQATTPVVASVEPVRPAQPEGESRLLAELQSMRDMLRQQIATLATKPAPESVAATAPAKRVMTRLLTAGFSADVARRIASHVPQDVDVAQAENWLHEVLAHNVRCADAADGIVERAGQPGTPGQIFALVGPTGVGKTTTVAKLAARFAVRHGTSALGLITLDAYRVAAPEQLRAYGRILGTPVHLAQDSATLRELLSTMVHKRLVLIDTCGVSQRDERLGEMLDLLATSGTASRPIQRVLLLNSASHAETLDEAARAWRAQDCTGAILTKLDEATRIGGSLDVSLRHRLTLLGVTNGQRVPEDWHAANSKLLAHLALKPAAHLFELADEEGGALVQVPPADANAAYAAHGALHG